MKDYIIINSKKVTTYEDGQRGLYLRQFSETHRVSEVNLKVSVIFHEKVESNRKVEFSKKIELQSHSKWIQHAQFILLTNNGKKFP